MLSIAGFSLNLVCVAQYALDLDYAALRAPNQLPEVHFAPRLA